MTEPEAPQRLRWWFPALFLIASIAAVVAVVAWDRQGAAGDSGPDSTPTLPDLAALSSEAPQPDDAAPDFSVRTVDGGTFTLGEHIATDGRPVLLNLWATWCPPCRAEMPLLQEASERHPEVRFVGIAIDDSEDEVTAFTSEVGVDYVIGLDDEDVVRDAYPVLGMPATFLIDPEGSIVDSHIGILTEESLEAMLAGDVG
jgi:thiol-disulfide isomerase/thioredoxin